MHKYYQIKKGRKEEKGKGNAKKGRKEAQKQAIKSACKQEDQHTCVQILCKVTGSSQHPMQKTDAYLHTCIHTEMMDDILCSWTGQPALATLRNVFFALFVLSHLHMAVLYIFVCINICVHTINQSINQ